MSRPVRISSKEQFYEILADYPIVFAMFYMSGDISTKAMLPIYEDLCKENSTPSIAFVKVNKEEYSSLCRKYNVPRNTSLTFVAWKFGGKLEVIDGENSKELEHFVHRHARKPKSPSPPPRPKKCDCRDAKEDEDEAGSSKSSPRQPRIVVEHRPRPRRYHLPFNVKVPKDGLEAHKAYPAKIRHRARFSPFVLERPAKLEYTGQDGHRRTASDVRIQRGEDGQAEATYMDKSGTLDVERTIRRKK